MATLRQLGDFYNPSSSFFSRSLAEFVGTFSTTFDVIALRIW
jgi:hypothetical protein